MKKDSIKQGNLGLQNENEIEILRNLAQKALTVGWSPEDIRCAELLTGSKCEWKHAIVH